MEVEDAPLVYGLELSSRCLCSQVGETNHTRFLVASQSLRQENQIHLLEYDDENNRLSKYVYRHPAGAVSHISASYDDASVFATCHDSYSEGKLHRGCTIWSFPSPLDGEDDSSVSSLNAAVDPATGLSIYDPGLSGQTASGITPLHKFTSEDDDVITHALFKPVDGDASLMTFGGRTMRLYDTNSGGLQSSFKVPEPKRPTDRAEAGKWNPHHGAKQFAVCVGAAVMGWDVRTDKLAFSLDAAHEPVTRELDFNPNKQYYILTCGDDSRIRFWDVRSPNEPLSSCGEDQHSHWVWSARFNPFHDQLVLSCSSDCKVALYDKSSVSSEPYGNFVDDEDDVNEGDDDDGEEVKKQNREPVEDHLISVYDEHEESVYAVEWSAAEPWSFASVSYDGRVVVNKVPKKVKFDILL